jgi:hypothetical protein
MALFAYLQQIQRFLEYDERQAIFNPADLTVFINEARGQIALSSQCIRQPALLTVTQGNLAYNFSDATFVGGPGILPGLQSVINVRQARLTLPTLGFRRLSMRSWEWYDTFHLSRTIPEIGAPAVAARLQPGLTGTLWIAPSPDGFAPYTLVLDAVGYPAPLVYSNGDADPEALPYPWTDAVPMLAAHLAYIAEGNAEAAAMWWNEYTVFERRAVQGTTPTRFVGNYPGGSGAHMVSQQIPLTAQMPQVPRR